MMTETAYTIRYRRCDSARTAALIVEDADGTAHLVGRRGFCVRWEGARYAPRLLSALHAQGWVPVPPGPPCTVEDLRRLLAPDGAPWPPVVYSA